MDKSHKNSFTTKRQILFNSEFEFGIRVLRTCVHNADG